MEHGAGVTEAVGRGFTMVRCHRRVGGGPRLRGIGRRPAHPSPGPDRAAGVPGRLARGVRFVPGVNPQQMAQI